MAAKTKVKPKKSLPRKPATKRSSTPTFRQRLGALTYVQACGMLGEQGVKWVREGEQLVEEVSAEGDVTLTKQDYALSVDGATARVWRERARSKELSIGCSVCGDGEPCAHQGAALAFLLDGKTALGLAEPPDESVPLENLTGDELRARALAERAARSKDEPMRVTATKPKKLWSDYLVTSRTSGRTYRVALRGMEAGTSYCSCPDFARNRLGTCKHVLAVQRKVPRRFTAAQRKKPYRRKNLSLRVHYGDLGGGAVGLRFNLPHKADAELLERVGDAHERSMVDVPQCVAKLETLEAAGYLTHVYPDAEALIQRALVQERVREACVEIRSDPTGHELRTGLLNAELLPYQLDGIAFAAGAGRAILADDMGLGKTIQGIGTAELLAQVAGISRVLVVCPASLKSQWRSEVQRFCGRSVQLIDGPAKERAELYATGAFFTVCNYEQVLRDVTAIEAVPWDLIVLDEGQRIKNWESKTSRVIQQLDSPFRLVLSGTPLENRLGELYTVVKFVDPLLLGPADRFFNRHRTVDERGKVIAFKKLDELREKLAPVLLRRTRSQVAKELPTRTDEVVRVAPTQEQKNIHDGQMRIAAQIAGKKWMTQMDVLRLRRALSMARMVCDSTWLVNQEEPEYSTKLERFSELMEDLIADTTRKVIVFSEWKRMLDRIEGRLKNLGLKADAGFVRLDGSVPQKKRPPIVGRFQDDPDCRVILMTNAGSTGLNLQSATTVVNVDLPWNPAVLEQRIGRAHRMGQKNPVHVYKLVTSDTIEERLLDTLANKQDLADAALDAGSDVESVSLKSGMSDLRQKLEKILDPLAATPAAPVDESSRLAAERDAAAVAERRAQVSAAGGQLVTAALGLAGQLVSREGDAEPEAGAVDRLTARLGECVERDADGRAKLTVTLPDEDALRGLAVTLARLLGEGA